MKKKHRIRIFPTLLFIGLVLFALHINAMNSLNKATNPDDTTSVIFEVASGETASEIIINLKMEDLIKSPYAFSKYLSKNNLDQSIQAGKYVLNYSMTGYDIIEVLTNTGAGEIAFTIIEGWTIADIDDALTDSHITVDSEFENCAQNCDFSSYEWLGDSLEGYLFPDTFFLDPNNFNAEVFIGRLLDNFEEKVLTEENLLAIEESGRTLEEIIIAASIIEKEVWDEEDRGIVSGILWKRLDSDWILGMCSTINYITGESEISYEDIEIDSPYNTRQVKGLPPTAISNPGLNSIEAALNPQETTYWYFLTATETGETIYSVTDNEHEMNKAKWL